MRVVFTVLSEHGEAGTYMSGRALRLCASARKRCSASVVLAVLHALRGSWFRSSRAFVPLCEMLFSFMTFMSFMVEILLRPCP